MRLIFAISFAICTVTFVCAVDSMLGADGICANETWINETFTLKRQQNHINDGGIVHNSLDVGLKYFEATVNRFCSAANKHLASHSEDTLLEQSMVGNLNLIAEEIISCSGELQQEIRREQNMFGFYAESFYGTAPSDGLSRGCGDADMPQLVEFRNMPTSYQRCLRKAHCNTIRSFNFLMGIKTAPVMPILTDFDPNF